MTEHGDHRHLDAPKPASGHARAVTFEACLAGAIDHCAEAYVANLPLGIATGIAGLDQIAGGLRPGDLTVLAGTSGSGRTSLVLQIAWHVCSRYAYDLAPDQTHLTCAGGRVLLYSLGTCEIDLALRCLVKEAGLNIDAVRQGQITALEFAKLRDRCLDLREAPLLINSTRAISLSRLVEEVREIQGAGGLDVVIVDDASLTVDDVSRYEAPDLLKPLKDLACETGVAVLVVLGAGDRAPENSVSDDIRQTVARHGDLVMIMTPRMPTPITAKNPVAVSAIIRETARDHSESNRAIHELQY